MPNLVQILARANQDRRAVDALGRERYRQDLEDLKNLTGIGQTAAQTAETFALTPARTGYLGAITSAAQGAERRQQEERDINRASMTSEARAKVAQSSLEAQILEAMANNEGYVPNAAAVKILDARIARQKREGAAPYARATGAAEGRRAATAPGLETRQQKTQISALEEQVNTMRQSRELALELHPGLVEAQNLRNDQLAAQVNQLEALTDQLERGGPQADLLRTRAALVHNWLNTLAGDSRYYDAENNRFTELGLGLATWAVGQRFDETDNFQTVLGRAFQQAMNLLDDSRANGSITPEQYRDDVNDLFQRFGIGPQPRVGQLRAMPETLRGTILNNLYDAFRGGVDTKGKQIKGQEPLVQNASSAYAAVSAQLAMGLAELNLVQPTLDTAFHVRQILDTIAGDRRLLDMIAAHDSQFAEAIQKGGQGDSEAQDLVLSKMFQETGESLGQQLGQATGTEQPPSQRRRERRRQPTAEERAEIAKWRARGLTAEQATDLVMSPTLPQFLRRLITGKGLDEEGKSELQRLYGGGLE